MPLAPSVDAGPMRADEFCLHDLVRLRARRAPTAPAILAPGRAPLSYARLQAQLDETIARLNAFGLGRHDRVALALPNGPEMAVALIAVASTATAAPLNPRSGADDLEAWLADLKAKAIIIQSGLESPVRTLAQARGLTVIDLSPVAGSEAGLFSLEGNEVLKPAPCVPARPADIAFILRTPGTTARPKLIPLTHANLCTAAFNLGSTLQLLEKDRCLNVMPLFHDHGLIASLAASLVAGASVACPLDFAPQKFCGWLEILRPTWYTAAPAIHQSILEHAVVNTRIISRAPLRFVRSSGAALTSRMATQLENVFQAPVIESYGMTETAHQIASNPLPPRTRKPGSAGRSTGLEIAIFDDTGALLEPGRIGEIAVRGESIASDGEYDAEASAFINGWFRTGDQGYLDEERYLFVTARIRDLIHRAGEIIVPREVDEALLAHPAVAQAATFAVPDAQVGEEVAAAVVLHPDLAARERDFGDFVAQRLSASKVPRHILIVEELPFGPTGQVARRDLSERLGLSRQNASKPAVAETTFVLPTTPLEHAVADIWTGVLGVKEVGVHDHFLAVGGDSTLATELISRVRELTSVELSPTTFFENPTVASLSRAIARRQAEKARSCEVPGER